MAEAASFPDSPVAAPDEPRQRSRLRRIVLALAGAQALYWAYTMWLGIRLWDDHRGYQWMAAFFSTPGFVAFTLPALLLGAAGWALRFALVWAVIGCVAVPFVVWGMWIAQFMDVVDGR